MVECATFADYIKYKGGSYQKGWHFIDIPYFDQGGDISDYPDFNLEPHNVTVAIDGIDKWFLNDDTTDNYPYDEITAHGYKEHTVLDDMSTAMRFLIHYTGDIHQPLHSTSRVDPSYPAGDRGGNSFPVQTKSGAKNLHQIWDSVVYSEATDMKTPFTDSDWDTIGQEAARLRTKYTDANLIEQGKNLDATSWSQENYELSKDYVYAGLKEGDLPTQEYIDRGSAVAQRQIVLAGTRMANLLMRYNYQRFYQIEDSMKYAEIEKLRIVPQKEKSSFMKFAQSIFGKFHN